MMLILNLLKTLRNDPFFLPPIEGGVDIAEDVNVAGDFSVAGRANAEVFLANVGTLSLTGDLDTYYPVYFDESTWHSQYPFFDLYIVKSSVHGYGNGSGGNSDGSLAAHFRTRPGRWGHSAVFEEATLIRHAGAKPYVADFRASRYTTGMVVWLLGGRTYQYSSSAPISQIKQNSSGNGIIVPRYSVESFGPIAEVSPRIETLGKTYKNKLMVNDTFTANGMSVFNSNVSIGTDASSADLDVIGDAVISGNLTVDGSVSFASSSSVVLSESSASAPGAIRYTSTSGFEGYVDDGENTPGWVSLTSGTAGPVTSLVSADDSNLIAVAVTGEDVAALNTTISGKVTLSTAQGDISMGVFGAN